MTPTMRRVLHAAPLLAAAGMTVGLYACSPSTPKATGAHTTTTEATDISISPPSPVYAAQATSPMGGIAAEWSEDYPHAEDGGVHRAAKDPISTFAADVDTASYANVRRFLELGQRPPVDAVRIEELVNYFDYAYPMPERPSDAFAITANAVPTPWNPETRLLTIGVQGREIPQDDRAPLNLVFLIDVSGSMDSPDKLPLVQQSLMMMLDGLDDDDTVGIVTYAGSAGIALRPTPVSARDEIEAAIEGLSAGGSTAGAEGISTAYELIEDHREDHGDRGRTIDRVILATDGDFNVGISDPGALVDFISEKRDEGIYLSVLGYGTGNLHDSTMQALAQNGNGNAAYIDSMREARKVLVEDLRKTVLPIADDVKIQVEFDPRDVRTWRLIGYETRPLETEDFDNDRVDAGEIGSGHQVTAIYEIEPTGRLASGFADIRLRWKAPGERESRLVERAVTGADIYDSFASAPQETRFAISVAAFGQLLRDNAAMAGTDFDEVATWAERALGSDPNGRRREFVDLAEIAGSVD